MSGNDPNNLQITTDEDLLRQCQSNFYGIATFQGRLAYFLMSIHAVNPYIWYRLSNYNPNRILFANMTYGVAVMIYSRPAMRPISFLNRLSFSVLGSLMFNYTSLLAYDFLVEKIVDRPILLTFFGFVTGRLMMLHLLAYLYHVDRCARVNVVRNPAFDSMYS